MEKYTTRDFDRDFPTDDACLEFLFHQRWPEGIHCDKCGKVTPHLISDNYFCRLTTTRIAGFA